MKFLSSSSVLLVFFALLVLLYHMGIGFYQAVDQEPHPTFEFLYSTGVLCSVTWWLQRDSRRHGLTPVYCPGLLVAIAWMVIVPYHLFRTRGLKGLLLLFGLLGVFIAAQFAAVIAYMLFSAWLDLS